MTSTPRSAMRLASSWMVITSGIVTSRTSFSLRLVAEFLHAPLVRRRNEASERSRTSSARQRGDERQAAARPFGRGLGGAVGLRRRRRAHAPPGPRRTCAAPPRLRLRARRRARRLAGAVARSRPRRTASWRPRRPCVLVSSSCLRRSSSSRLRASAAVALGALDGVALRRGSWPLLRQSCALRPRAGGHRRARGRGGAFFLGQGAQHHAGRLRRRARPGRRGGAVRGARPWPARRGRRAWRGAAGAGGRRPTPRACPRRRCRRFLTSTTTCLVRPWLKLWRTTPVSARGLSDRVVRADAQLLPPGVLVSAIPFSNPLSSDRGLRRRSPGLTGPKALKARKRARNVSLAGPASRAACTTFDRPNAKSNCAE